MVQCQVLLDDWQKRLQPGDRVAIRSGICLRACTLERRTFSWWREEEDVTWDIVYDRLEYDTEDRHSMASASGVERLPYPGMTGVIWDPRDPPWPARRRRRRRRSRRKVATA